MPCCNVFLLFRLAKVGTFKQLRKSFGFFLQKKVINSLNFVIEARFLIIFAP
jgi:hypothetical protein